MSQWNSLPSDPGDDYVLTINEFGEYEWRRVRKNRWNKHLLIALAFNFGTWAFFGWVLWHSL